MAKKLSRVVEIEHMLARSRDIYASYIRNFIFGVEDSLVSTVGLLSGIAVAGVPAKTIILTGVILISVESFSMAAGSFLAEHSAQDYLRHSEVGYRQPLVAGLIMFFSYFFSGLIPLFPYFVFDINSAFRISVALSLLSLFLLGVWSAKISEVRLWHDGLRMLVVGGLAVAVGVFVGRLISVL